MSYNPFDHAGKLLREHDDAAIAKLSKPQRDALFALFDAGLQTEQADQAFADAEKATRAAARDVSGKVDAYSKIIPKPTFYDCWRRDVAKLPVAPTPPALVKKAAEAAKVAEEAQVVLDQRRTEENTAKRQRDDKRKAFAAALAAWSKVDERPRSTADLVRLNSAAEIKRKMAIINGEIEPDPVEPPPQYQWPIQVAMAGHRGTVNADYRRKVRPLPKLPSER